MQFRLNKVGMVAGPLVLIAGIIILGVVIWAMQGVFYNGVVFHGESRALSAHDKTVIRTLVLSQSDLSIHGPFERYTIQFQQKRMVANSATWTGFIYSNQDASPIGIATVTKQDGQWKMVFFGMSKSAA